MTVIVHGVDLVEISRIESMLADHGAHFLDRVFTADEQRYADSGGHGRGERYAARFAAKEAVFKAVGTGWSGGLAWRDIAVSNAPGGAPQVSVSGHVQSKAEALGVTTWVLSLSHAGNLAMASVIGHDGAP